MRYLASLLCFFLCACVTPSPHMTPGIREAYRSYVPAKTAVLPCRPWPANLNFKSLQSNSSETDKIAFCKSVDAHIFDSFKSQTFMRGFTPHAVEKSLRESKKLPLLNTFLASWWVDLKQCGDCADIATFYERVVKPRREWREWVLDFSTGTHHSDAVLVPFLSFAREDKENDRGLLLSKRSMGLVLLLIDTQSGDLIWTSKRKSVASNHSLIERGGPNFPEFPEWNLVTQDLLIDSLWREYPGRIFI